MEKIDHRKLLKQFYAPSAKEVELVDIPAFNYLMVDGTGAPGGKEYVRAIETLYPVAYSLKFAVKRGPMAIDYRVLPLEGLWWADDMTAFTEDGRKDEWKWTLMIMQPPLIDRSMVDLAGKQVAQKKNPGSLNKLRFESFSEGHCVQILHKGPFDEEGPNIEKLHTHIKELGKSLAGKHHEIYLSDMRRTAPEKLRTILRQPMQ